MTLKTIRGELVSAPTQAQWEAVQGEHPRSRNGGRMNLPAFPKPGQVTKAPVAVKVFRDGREVCSQLTKAGRDEYAQRKRLMWERQRGICCLAGHIKGCPGKLALADAMFEHENGRGGGKQDDRIEVNGKWQNGVAHAVCNSLKGSRRIQYNDAP